MSTFDRENFLQAAKSGTTKRYHIRVMIVGENSSEKTYLLRRLMNEKIEVSLSSDRLDIKRRQCKINVKTDEWYFSTADNVPFSSWCGDSEQFADCVFWDFAGKKELYATHQTFLTPNALYLLVIDISKDFTDTTYNDMTEREFDSIELLSISEYIDFWLNNIHCYATDVYNGSKKDNEIEEVMPSIIMVCTGCQKSIVLDPDWLVDIFRCVVSPVITAELTEFQDMGMLRNNLIIQLFEKVPVLGEQTDFVLQILEHFDIIIRSINDDTTKCFYMPCMIKTLKLSDITFIFDLNNGSHASAWFCLDFDVLPQSFFIHLLVRFVEDFKPCMKKEYQPSFYRNVGIFNIDRCGSQQLVVCQSNNIVAMQVWQKNGMEHSCYSDIKNKMIDFVKSTKQHYHLNITYEQKLNVQMEDYVRKRELLTMTFL
ncbi:LRRK2 [Mytilus edulis]|uniref:LRRK2 n=1 Tax=Mytilus edulis TaxID=6550 RepID=A0A8S3R9N3_MYTED|nr:LRRK2 [Mytilus edulis]